MASFQSLLLQPSFSRLQAAHTGEFDLELQPRYGPPIPCHASLLRARCPLLQIERPCMSVDEDHEVISVLLEWVYCEKIHFRGAEGSVGLGLAERTLRLAAKLGLRDALALRERLYGNWRRRSSGCLSQDLVRSFHEQSLDNLWFLCGEPGANQVCKAVYGGFLPVLLQASSYFAAMLSGKWAETAHEQVKVGWPAEEFERLMEFLHGGQDFIRDAQDLEKALRCADFFGLPVLVVHANQWIADHLDSKNGSQLWNFVDSEPRLRLKQVQDSGLHADFFVDAEDACFDFHVREFLALAWPDADSEADEDCWVPLHDLSPSLMQRLLRSGSLDVSTERLKAIVLRYARAKWDKSLAQVHAKQMMPPNVLFNRDIRDQLLGGVTMSIRAVL